jgi:outer membrane receptor protein involved in Fe transport
MASTAVLVSIAGADRAFAADEAAGERVGEVVVTGTYLKDKPIAPMATVTREQVEQAGFVDVGQVLRSLPQNSAGGFNPEAQKALPSGLGQIGFNRTQISAANLRGLGNGATLTLLNGRRLPPAGEGIAADLNMIPLAAFERVDVLADGASAIYGSDAVAGVVNIITRHHYDGGEVRARYGGAQGGLGTGVGSVLLGGEAGPASGVVAMEYFRQDELGVDKRDRAEFLPRPRQIVERGTRASVYAGGDYDLSPDVRLNIDGLYTRKTGYSVSRSGSSLNIMPRTTSQYFVSPGMTFDLPRRWSLEVFGSASQNITNTPITTLSATSRAFTPLDQRSQVNALEARASGDAGRLPAGPIALAVGAAYREERIASHSTPTFGGQRHVTSAYAEAGLPIFTWGDESFAKLNLAVRHDDYSDFGAVTVPKVAALWSISSELELTATYSKSFRAPSLYEQASNYTGAYVDVVDTGGAVTRGLYLQGNGKPLSPERAKTYEASIRYRPAWAPRLDVTLDWYKIDYTDRITVPDPAFAYAFDVRNAPSQLLVRNPDATTINAFVSGAQFTYSAFGAPTDPAALRLIIDTRGTNFAAVKYEGFDLSATYSQDLGPGALTLTSVAAYISKYDEQGVAGAPFVTRVNTIFYPADFKARTGALYSVRSLEASAFWNYVDSYTDNRVANAPKPIKSWSTFDFGLRYTLGEGVAPVFKGVRLILSITNAFDKNAPKVTSGTTAGFGPATEWDPTNASVIGRFTSLEVVKTW